MKQIELDRGSAWVAIMHGWVRPPYDIQGHRITGNTRPLFEGCDASQFHPAYMATLCRGTLVRLRYGDRPEDVLDGISYAKPPDTFARKVGRRMAAQSLLRKMRDAGHSEEDRRLVFRAVCPEFAPPDETPPRFSRRQIEAMVAKAEANLAARRGGA